MADRASISVPDMENPAQTRSAGLADSLNSEVHVNPSIPSVSFWPILESGSRGSTADIDCRHASSGHNDFAAIMSPPKPAPKLIMLVG
jgi:hypothetical protein